MPLRACVTAFLLLCPLLSHASGSMVSSVVFFRDSARVTRIVSIPPGSYDGSATAPGKVSSAGADAEISSGNQQVRGVYASQRQPGAVSVVSTGKGPSSVAASYYVLEAASARRYEIRASQRSGSGFVWAVTDAWQSTGEDWENAEVYFSDASPGLDLGKKGVSGLAPKKMQEAVSFPGNGEVRSFREAHEESSVRLELVYEEGQDLPYPMFVAVVKNGPRQGTSPARVDVFVDGLLVGVDAVGETMPGDSFVVKPGYDGAIHVRKEHVKGQRGASYSVRNMRPYPVKVRFDGRVQKGRKSRAEYQYVEVPAAGTASVKIR